MPVLFGLSSIGWTVGKTGDENDDSDNDDKDYESGVFMMILTTWDPSLYSQVQPDSPQHGPW